MFGRSNDQEPMQQGAHEQAPAPLQQAPSEETGVPDAGSEATALIERIEGELAKLKQAEEQRERAVREHADRERAFTEQLQELHSALEAERERLQTLESQHAEATQRSEALTQRCAELDGAHQRAVEHASALEQERDAARGELDTIRTDLDGARRRAEQHASDAEQQRDGARAELEALRTELDGAHRRVEVLEGERDQASRSLDEMRSAHEQSGSADAAQRARIDELTHAIGTLERRVEGAEARERELTEALEDARRRASQAEARVQEAESAREELASREESRAVFEVSPDDFNAQRRRRLGGVRAALQERTKQLYKVKKVLEQKAREIKEAGAVRQQAEQMLFEARERRTESEQRFAAVCAMRAKGASGVFVLCLTLAWLAALAGAWFGVGMVLPGTFSASAVVSCDTRGLDEADQRAEAWTTFALALPQDPRFLERASQRMRTRAYDDLGTPSDLRAFFERHAVVESSSPGQISIEITGEGSDRTRRMLETLTTGIVAYANETKDRRADGSPTKVITPASSAERPIEDRRPMIAGMVAGGLTALLLLVAVITWRTARRSLADSAREALQDLERSPAAVYVPSVNEEGR